MVGTLHIKVAFRMTISFMELSMKTHLKEFWIRRNWLDNHAWMVVGAFSTNVVIRYSTQKMTPLTISLLQPISHLSGIGISTIPNHRGAHQNPITATHTSKKQNSLPRHILTLIAFNSYTNEVRKLNSCPACRTNQKDHFKHLTS